MNVDNNNQNIKKFVAGSSLELTNQPSWQMGYTRLSFHILPWPPVTGMSSENLHKVVQLLQMVLM